MDDQQMLIVFFIVFGNEGCIKGLQRGCAADAHLPAGRGCFQNACVPKRREWGCFLHFCVLGKAVRTSGTCEDAGGALFTFAYSANCFPRL